MKRKVVLPLKKNWRMKRSVIFFVSLVIFTLYIDLFSHVWNQCYSHTMQSFHSTGRWLVMLLYAVLLAVFSVAFNAYQVGRLKAVEILYSQILTLFFVNVISYFQLCLTSRTMVSIKAMLGLLGVQIVFAVLWTSLSDRLYRKLFPPETIAVVYDGRSPDRDGLLGKLNCRPEQFQLSAYLDCRQEDESLLQELSGYDAILLHEIPCPMRNRLLKFCYARSISVYMTPDITDIVLHGAEEIEHFEIPLLYCRNDGLTPDQHLNKRILDLILCLLCTLTTLPLMAGIAVAVKCYDGGPVLFRQKRCTMGGKVFEILKFRSMVVDAEKNGIFRPESIRDPRITPIGRFLRKTHLDELPQLFNILRGDMSFVGPRPERVEHVMAYTREIPEFSYRLKVKGGLTGYAQIMGAYHTSAYDKLKLDLMYIQNYSLFLDLKLLLLTIKSIFTEGDRAQRNNPAAPPVQDVSKRESKELTRK